jgi:streptogramin lyase
VSDIAEAPDGGLWVAGDGELYRLDQERWYGLGWPAEGWVESIAVGPDGSVWAGYDALARFDPASGTWQGVASPDGQASLGINSLYVTPEGVVWLGTGSGMIRFVVPTR